MQIQKRNLAITPSDKISFTYVIGSPMVCILILENLTTSKVYFKIISTLCKQLTIKPQSEAIEAGQSTAVELSLVHEHNVQYNLEKIGVISSTKPFLYKFVVEDSAEKDVINVEVQKVPEQTNIRPEFIRINESVAFKTKGNQLYKQGDYQGALEKYQQAIAIYRYDVKYYSNEVLTYSKMKRFEEAANIIEKVLLFDPHNAKVLSAKAILFAELSKNQENQSNKLLLLKQGLILLEQAKKFPSTNITAESIQQIIDKIKVLENRVGNLNTRDFSEYLLNSGLIKDQEKFSKAGFDGLFKNKEEFNDYLKTAVQTKDLQTPEYVLDPLSYEILKHPLIIPSGISYDDQVIKDFFKRLGPVDPITKMPLNLNLIFQNKNLQDFIKNNEQLAGWRETEAQILHANDQDIEF